MQNLLSKSSASQTTAAKEMDVIVGTGTRGNLHPGVNSDF